MPVNSAMVAVMLILDKVIQLDAFSYFLNMPNMSNPLYQRIHNDLNKHTENTVLEAMEMADKEEVRLTVEENNVKENGIPIITVVADVTWPKRSYKSNYNGTITIWYSKY
jgi:hypothetical protein